MEITSPTFKRNAVHALADRQLQKALGNVRAGFIDKRRKAVDALPEFDQLRDNARAIKDHTLANLDRTKAPDRWVNAKIALGRALRLRADQKFDPLILREAVDHLQEAMDALRGEPRLRLAEAAAQAIADSKRLLSGQRKFSITGGGI